MSDRDAPYQWNLPFAPYPIQVDLMTALSRTLDAGHSGIFESPTGTGKSLSLICAVVPWLQAHPAPAPPPPPENSPSWVYQHQIDELQRNLARRSQLKAQRDARHAEQITRPVVIEDRKRAKRPRSASSNSSASSSASAKQRDEEVKTFSALRKVFYCSRTHSQLSQFLHELKRVFGSTITAVALGSRKQLCVNDALPRNERLNEACVELQEKGGCSYRTNERGSLVLHDAALFEIHDIEDVVRRAKAVHACAYYTARDALKSAQVVVLPYSLLLHEKTRDALGIDLEGHVVVCDEAHNVIDAVADMHSCVITRAQLDQAHAELQMYITKYRERLGGDHAQTLTELASVARKLAGFCAKEARDAVWPLADFLRETAVEHNNLFALVDGARETRLANKLNGIARELAKANAAAAAAATAAAVPGGADAAAVVSADSTMHRLLQFLEALNSRAEDGRVHVSPQPAAQLKFLLLNPGSRFAKVVEKAHAVVLAGGTMHPVSDIVDQLFGSLPRDRVDSFSCGHVIPKDNLVAIACRTGALRGAELRLVYEERNKEPVLDDIAATLQRVCAIVPAGVVVFFPSYNFENAVAARMQATGAMAALAALKPVLREKSSENVLEAFSGLIAADPKRGAVLFAVVGGKLSEGINFSDDLARCVCVVGLPYASKTDPELNARMAFLRSAPGGGNEAANRYYENLCWRGVNQSIGRAIRHAKDYAAIVVRRSRAPARR